jgi:hypothetical protein
MILKMLVLVLVLALLFLLLVLLWQLGNTATVMSMSCDSICVYGEWRDESELFLQAEYPALPSYFVAS